MQRFLDRGPFALRDHDDALGLAARDRDRRFVGHHLIHHCLEIGAGVREAEGFHGNDVQDFVQSLKKLDRLPRAAPP